MPRSQKCIQRKKREKVMRYLLNITKNDSTLVETPILRQKIPNKDMDGVVALKSLINYDPINVSNCLRTLMMNFLTLKFFMVPPQSLIHEYVKNTASRTLRFDGPPQEKNLSFQDEENAEIDGIAKMGSSPAVTEPRNQDETQADSESLKINEIKISDRLLDVLEYYDAVEQFESNQRKIESEASSVTRREYDEPDPNQPGCSAVTSPPLPTLHQVEINFMNHLNTMTNLALDGKENAYLSPLLSAFDQYNRHYLSIARSDAKIEIDAEVVKKFLDKRRRHHEANEFHSVRSGLRALFFKMWINLIDIELNITTISEGLALKNKNTHLLPEDYEEFENNFLQNLLGL